MKTKFKVIYFTLFSLYFLKLNGIAREYTLTGLDLNDGISYYVKLIVCNGAQICTETETDKIQVDSTPPSSGKKMIFLQLHVYNITRVRGI